MTSPGFDLHFSNDWLITSFHVLIEHLCVFFGKIPVFSFPFLLFGETWFKKFLDSWNGVPLLL